LSPSPSLPPFHASSSTRLRLRLITQKHPIIHHHQTYRRQFLHVTLITAVQTAVFRAKYHLDPLARRIEPAASAFEEEAVTEPPVRLFYSSISLFVSFVFLSHPSQ
jgi:hypothetical protein